MPRSREHQHDAVYRPVRVGHGRASKPVEVSFWFRAERRESLNKQRPTPSLDEFQVLRYSLNQIWEQTCACFQEASLRHALGGARPHAIIMGPDDKIWHPLEPGVTAGMAGYSGA